MRGRHLLFERIVSAMTDCDSTARVASHDMHVGRGFVIARGRGASDTQHRDWAMRPVEGARQRLMHMTV